MLELLLSILLIGSSLVKAYWLSCSVTQQGVDWGMAFQHLINDYALLLPCLALLLLAMASRRVVRFVILLFISFFCLWHFTDTVSILLVGTRLHINDILLLADDLETLFDVVPPWSLFCPLLFLPLALLRIKLRANLAGNLCILVCLLYVVALFFVDRTSLAEGRYYSSIRLIVRSLRVGEENQELYGAGDILKYKLSEPVVKAEIPEEKPNIVLVIVEALSAIDSMRTAHSFNLLPQLDELSKDGMLFTNLMANHTHSAGGIVGIFHGSPPFNYPGTIAGPYRSYEGLPSTLGLFKQAGYTTGILFAVPEDQLHLRRWAEHTGFDFLGSPTSIERIKSQPRFVINSVSDKVILEEALLRIDSYLLQKSPFFFSVVTNSTHTPYEHPEGKDNTEEAIWKYTDEQLAIFYHALRQRDFFENGILIITGDHRKRSPVTERERELYQDSALTRSLMIVIGKNVPSNQIDARFIQHSEVIPHLSSLKDPSRPLSEVMYFVDQPGTLPNGSYCQEPGKAFLAKEEARTAHNFCLEGTKIQWLSERPSNGDAIEREIHGRRSYFQSLAHAKNQHVCPIEFDGALDVGEHGVALDIYEGLRLDSDLRGLQPDQSYLVDNLALKKLPNHDAHKDLLYTLDAILEVDTPGTYKFTLGSPGEACLRIGEHYLLYKDWATSDPQLLLERYVIDNTKLEAGRHRLQMRVRLDHSPLDPYLLLFMSEVSAKESRTISKSKLYVPSAAR